MKKSSIILLSVISLLILSSCAISGVNFGYAGTNRNGKMSYNYISFNSSEKHTIELTAGDTLSLDVEAEVLDGSLVFKVLNPGNEVIWSLKAEEEVNKTAEITIDESGLYNLVVEGNQTKGNFKFRWKN